MSRWKYPFKTQREAEKYLRLAAKESKRDCFVRKITYEVCIFKIFSSPAEYKAYKAKKKVKR